MHSHQALPCTTWRVCWPPLPHLSPLVSADPRMPTCSASVLPAMRAALYCRAPSLVLALCLLLSCCHCCVPTLAWRTCRSRVWWMTPCWSACWTAAGCWRATTARHQQQAQMQQPAPAAARAARGGASRHAAAVLLQRQRLEMLVLALAMPAGARLSALACLTLPLVWAMRWCSPWIPMC